MKIGQVYVFPIFNHAGYNGTYPAYCECDDEDMRYSQYCNYFHFISGFLFYEFDPSETSTDSLNRLHHLVFNSSVSGSDVNRKAFDISYDNGNTASLTRGDQDWKNKHYEFCRSQDGKFCSLLSIYSTFTSSSITSFHFPVYNGSCNDFVSLDEEAAERFVNTPPTPLVEPYMKCKRTIFAAIVDSVGIVSGNISAMSPLIMLAVFYLYFYGYIQWKGVKQDVTYSQTELDAIARILTFNMALARDGLHPKQLRAEAAAAAATSGSGTESSTGQRDKQAILEESVLLRLLEELKQEEVLLA